MNLKSGDMWSAYQKAGLFLFTANSTITQDGRLVMGRGIAREVRDRFAGIDKAIAASIKLKAEKTPKGLLYGLLVSERWPDAKIGAFQVKYHWQSNADMELITNSSLDLAMWILYHPDVEVHLNFPGIGNGRLDSQRVYNGINGIFHGLSQLTLWTREPLEL